MTFSYAIKLKFKSASPTLVLLSPFNTIMVHVIIRTENMEDPWLVNKKLSM